MKITVDKQPKRFYLACNRWTPVVGHEIQVGKYRFCATPIKGRVIVSEVTSGAKVSEIQLSFLDMMMTETKEGTLEFFKTVVGEKLLQIVNRNGSFLDKSIEKYRKKAVSMLGKMPPVKNVDLEVGMNGET